MMKLKKPKTALREGFQSVIDYWPESLEATGSAALQEGRFAEAVEPLLRSYALRFPKVVKSLDGDNLEERVRGAVVVWLRPA